MKNQLAILFSVLFLSSTLLANNGEFVLDELAGNDYVLALDSSINVAGNYYKCAKAKNLCTGHCQKYDPTITCNNNCYYDYKICMGE